MTVFFLDPTVTAGSDFPYDASSGARTLTTHATVTSIGANSKFGYGAVSFNLPGANVSSIISVADAADWLFTGQFTVEAWIYLQATSGGSVNQVIAASGASSTSVSWAFSVSTDQTALQFQYSTNGTTWTLLSGTKAFALNTWYHVAVDRDAGGVIRLYCDGVMLASVTMATALFDSTVTLGIGNYGGGGSNGRFPGLIEELRITNGTARYASNAGYTVPTSEFPTNSTDDPAWDNVKLLLRGPGGTTVKGRFRSFAALTTLRCAAGDQVRLAATPAAVASGSATWTNNSRFVTLDAARTANIDLCEAVWTNASANITMGVNLNNRKHGTACLSLQVAGAFTTGKIAYKTLGSTLDLSSYQQVSLWVRSSLTPVLNSGELRLCSDTTGDVPVHVIPLVENVFTSSIWRVVVKDFGANLASNIKSISVYAQADPGTTTFLLDNIIACKASSSPDALTHLSLIGKNTGAEPEWYPINSIDGTTLELGSYAEGSGNATPRPYFGTTETVSLYRLQPLDSVNGYASPAFYATPRALPVSGTDGNPILISGGWNSTYTTQTGVTWLSGANAAAAFIDVSNRSWITFARIGAAHFSSQPITWSASSQGLRVQLEGVAGCTAAMANAYGAALYLDLGNIVGANNGLAGSANGVDATVVVRRITGCTAAGVIPTVGNGAWVRYYIDQIDSSPYAVQPSSFSGRAIFYNTRLANSSASDVLFSGGTMLFINPLMQSATGVLYNSPSLGDSIRCQNFNRDATDQRSYFQWGTVQTDTSVRHAATGMAWKMSITSVTNINSSRPALLPLMRRKLAAGMPVSVSCWVRRDNTGMACGIKVFAGSLAGIGSPGVDVSAAMTAAANTWELLSLSLTPTEDGVVEVFGWGWTSATTYSCWFDDLSVT